MICLKPELQQNVRAIRLLQIRIPPVRIARLPFPGFSPMMAAGIREMPSIKP